MNKHLCNVTLEHDWQPILLADIEAAHSCIRFSALSMLPPRGTNISPWGKLWKALKAARARAVEISVYLPTPQRAHPATLQNATSAHIAHALGWNVYLIEGPRLLHAKQFAIDNAIAWIGSANLTAAAFNHNRERFVRIESAHIAATLLEYLNERVHAAYANH